MGVVAVVVVVAGAVSAGVVVVGAGATGVVVLGCVVVAPPDGVARLQLVLSTISYRVPSAVLTRVIFSPSFSVAVGWPLSNDPPTMPTSTDFPFLAIETRRKMFSSVGKVPATETRSQTPLVAIRASSAREPQRQA